MHQASNYSQEARTHKVLSNDDLVRRAPSIFADSKHHTRGDRYVHIPTFDVIEGLRKEGFLPVHVTQARPRTEDRASHTKHIIRFRHESQLEDTRAYSDWRSREWFETALINAHDGTSAYLMNAAMFRATCLNGMVASDALGEVRVRHSGKTALEQVVQGMFTILAMKDRVLEMRDMMAATVLDADEQRDYAETATSIRYANAEVLPVNPINVLEARRAEDVGSDLWRTFNRAQENLTQGGQRTENRLRRTYTRPISGVTDLQVNKALWDFTQRVAELKNGIVRPEAQA